MPRNIPEARDFADNGDYAFNSQYEFIGTNWIHQAVMLALFTTKGSMATDPKFGNNVPNIQVIDISFENKVKQAVMGALRHLIPKYVKINSIDIEVHPLGSVEYTVTYTNLINRTIENVRI
jgi:phage baseplate assembly protein W